MLPPDRRNYTCLLVLWQLLFWVASERTALFTVLLLKDFATCPRLRIKEFELLFFLYCIVHIYPPFTRKRIVSLYQLPRTRPKLFLVLGSSSWKLNS